MKAHLNLKLDYTFRLLTTEYQNTLRLILNSHINRPGMSKINRFHFSTFGYITFILQRKRQYKKSK